MTEMTRNTGTEFAISGTVSDHMKRIVKQVRTTTCIVQTNKLGSSGLYSVYQNYIYLSCKDVLYTSFSIWLVHFPTLPLVRRQVNVNGHLLQPLQTISCLELQYTINKPE